MKSINSRVREIMREIIKCRVDFDELTKDPNRYSKDKSVSRWQKMFDEIARKSFMDANEILRNVLGAIDD